MSTRILTILALASLAQVKCEQEFSALRSHFATSNAACNGNALLGAH
jgi:hypothetical protein